MQHDVAQGEARGQSVAARHGVEIDPLLVPVGARHLSPDAVVVGLPGCQVEVVDEAEAQSPAQRRRGRQGRDESVRERVPVARLGRGIVDGNAPRRAAERPPERHIGIAGEIVEDAADALRLGLLDRPLMLVVHRNQGRVDRLEGHLQPRDDDLRPVPDGPVAEVAADLNRRIDRLQDHPDRRDIGARQATGAAAEGPRQR